MRGARPWATLWAVLIVAWGTTTPLGQGTTAFAQGAVTQGAVTQGAVTQGAVTQGAVTQGAVTQGAAAQGAVPKDVGPLAEVVDLAAAVRAAVTSSTRVAESSAGVEASAADEDEVKTALLPRVDAMIQLNRATNNNVSGTLFPTALFPVITGPVPAGAEYAGSWGMALSVFFAWDVLDFGRRAAQIRHAAGRRVVAREALAQAQLLAAGRAASAFLSAAAADAWLRAARASVVRWDATRTRLRALADAKLRATTDVDQAELGWQGATIDVVRAREIRARLRATLARAMGRPRDAIREDASAVLRTAPSGVARGHGASAAAELADHPRLRGARAAVFAQRLREEAVARQAYPELRIVGFAAGRAAGADGHGAPLGGAHGLYPEAFNWGAGVMLVAPLVEGLRVRAAGRSAAADRKAAQARLLRAERALEAQARRATSDLRAAREIASLTPARAVAAVRVAADVHARFTAGLVPFTELAEAERQRTAAEVEDTVARLRVWQARLALALATGDLAPFLNEASGTAP